MTLPSQQLTALPDVITSEQIQKALPKGVSLRVTDDLLVHINGLLQDPDMQVNFQENLLSYTRVLQEGKFKPESYVAAVEYVSRKLLGDSNEIAFSKVFPTRYNKLLTDNKSPKVISSHVSAYHNSKLVGLILAQTMTPVWVHNQRNLQKAINCQVEIMEDDKASYMAKTAAANSLLTHLKQPEAAKVELDIVVTEDNALNDLRNAVSDFAKRQREAIESGIVTSQEVAHSRITPKETDIVIDP